MDKIFCKLNFIAQQPNVFVIRIAFKQAAIHGPQRQLLPEVDCQTFEKNSFQSIFKRFVSFQTIRREFPKARELPTGGPFAHQNPTIFPYNTANCKHLSPILELLPQLFILISFIFLLNLQISYMIDTFCRFGKGVKQ